MATNRRPSKPTAGDRVRAAWSHSVATVVYGPGFLLLWKVAVDWRETTWPAATATARVFGIGA